MIILFDKKEECCGCTACKSICPNQAISMQLDEGFLFPVINGDLCMECGLCKTACIINNKLSTKQSLAIYAAIHKDQIILKNSSSGGVFTALASLALDNRGVVFGCALNSEMEAEHISVDNVDDLKMLNGSKYVQSNVKNTFIEAKKSLQEARLVLYTGTPCQIAGFKSFLGKDYDNLITVDLICHGVPSPTLFKEYINWLGENQKAKVIDLSFRDKTKHGLGLMGKVTYQKNDITREEAIYPLLHAYYYYFLQGDIYRESCYKCKFACSDRQGDFTLGDYWGIEKAHQEINAERGVSVILVNSKKGMKLLDKIGECLNLTQSTFEKASAGNGNLLHPTHKSDKRELILKVFRDEGYQAVDDMYRKSLGKRLVWVKVKAMIPVSFKNRIKRKLGRM